MMMSNETPAWKGFDRVVINKHGEALSPMRAVEHGVMPNIGFLRSDGWALGCTKELEHVAKSMWAGDWTHRIEFPSTTWVKL